jgi:hypothetical protein
MIRVFILGCCVFSLVLFSTVAGIAQEVWLRPHKYFYEPGEEAVIQIQSGENFIGEELLLDPSAITFLEHWNRHGNRNLVSLYRKENKASFGIKFEKEGYQSVFFKTNQSYELDGESFSEYLKQYGWEAYQSEREENGIQNQPVALSLRHHVQLSVRSGKSDAKGWIKPPGFPVVIVPDKNPQTLRRGDRIHFTILEDGKPAFGVRVKIWNRWDNRTTIQNIYTEQDGVVSTTISNPGDWMVTVVRLKKGTRENEYVGENISLVFGYR